MAEVFDFGLQEHKIKMDGGFSNNGLFAVVGDTARRLEVQLLNSNNAIQDTTGINLRLNAEVAGKLTFVDAVVKDATKGIYTVNLSNGMFLEPGNWAFQWQITKGANKISSFPFAVKIGENISEGGSQATNFYVNLEDLKAMQDDLVNGTIDSSVLETNITEKLTNLETQYAPRLTEVTAQLAQKAQQVDLTVKAKEMEIREVLMKQTFKSRSNLSNYTNPKKVLLLGYPNTKNEQRERDAYVACKRMLLHAKIPFDESTIDLTPAENKATDYGIVLISYALSGDITTQPGYFDGSLGVPTIVVAGGAGWHSFTSSTGVSSVQGDGAHHYHLPGGRDFYTMKSERFNIAPLDTSLDIKRIIYDPLDDTKSFVWSIRGVENITLYCSNYSGGLVGPWVLYYIRQWGQYFSSIPLPFCVDIDDVNQVTDGNAVDIEKMKDVYDWSKEVDLVITSGVKTDQMVDQKTRFPTGEPTVQTKFAQEHQDVFIPIVHDHNYAYQGGSIQNKAKTTEELISDHKERLKVAHDYGFGIPYNMWGYLFQPWNNYTDYSITFWKKIGIVAARDAGSGDGVYASDMQTIPENVRENLAEPRFMWVNTNQFVPASANSIQETIDLYGETEVEWRGRVCHTWVRNVMGSFPPSSFRDNKRVHEPSFSVLYTHGNNVNNDNPFLEGMKLGDNIRQAFPDTVIYSHPASVIGRSTITNLA